MGLLNPIDKSFCLEQLCAANYQKLFRLIPNLQAITESSLTSTSQQSPLQLKIIERTPYTLTIELSHCFLDNDTSLSLPAVIIRIYLDAKLAEALSDYARDPVSQVFADASASKAIMDYKWRLNYFLQKWLDHCLQQPYNFDGVALIA